MTIDLNTPIEGASGGGTSPPLTFAQLTDLRSRVLAGEEVSSEEYRTVLETIRRARSAAPAARGRKAATAQGTAPVVDDF